MHVTNNKPSVAFIGTGIMGGAMARHLLEAGYPLTVCNRTPQKCAALVEKGARLAATPAEAAKDADVVITMVGYPEEVEELYLSRGGLLEASKPGAYLIDMTTSSPELARDIHEVAEVSDRHAFDAPVTGGQQGAENATLTVFCGAGEDEVAPVRPLLETLGSEVLAFGAAGKGQLAKLANQTALAGCMVGVVEALSLARSGGLDTGLLIEALRGGMADSTALEVLAPKMVARDFAPGFKVEHYVKDLGLILQAAEDADLTLPGVETANELYNLLAEIGGKQMGTQALDLVYADEPTCAAHGLDWSVLSRDDDEDLDGFVGADHGDCGCDQEHGHGRSHAHAHGHDGDCGCDCDGDCDCDDCGCGCDCDGRGAEDDGFGGLDFEGALAGRYDEN